MQKQQADGKVKNKGKTPNSRVCKDKTTIRNQKSTLGANTKSRGERINNIRVFFIQKLKFMWQEFSTYPFSTVLYILIIYTMLLGRAKYALLIFWENIRRNNLGIYYDIFILGIILSIMDYAFRKWGKRFFLEVSNLVLLSYVFIFFIASIRGELFLLIVCGNYIFYQAVYVVLRIGFSSMQSTQCLNPIILKVMFLTIIDIIIIVSYYLWAFFWKYYSAN